MSFTADEYTSTEVCRRLSIAIPFLGKMIRELRLPTIGKGKRRVFTTEEYEIFRTVKLMRGCAIPWSDIKDARSWSLKAKEQVLDLLKSVWGNSWPSEIDKRKHTVLKIFFPLEFPLEVPFLEASPEEEGFSMDTDDGTVETFTFSMFQEKVKEILEEARVTKADNFVRARLERFKEDIKEYESKRWGVEVVRTPGKK